MSPKLKDLIVGLCLFALSNHTSLAQAGETKGSGTVTYALNQIANIPLGGNRNLTEYRMSGVVIATDATPPFHLSSQDCVGSGIGEGKGWPEEDHGACVAFDKDGDAWWLSYRNKGDDRKWTVVSGTGKYSGMMGSGTTKLLAITSDGRMVISWNGTMQMK